MEMHMNRENLLKLAEFLKTFDDRNDELSAFGMGAFRKTDSAVGWRHKCKTTCCALGSGPEATGIKRSPVNETWPHYLERVFGIEDFAGREYEWCFDSRWRFVDNTPIGAAKRILWMLDHGVPFDCYEQMTGKIPVCYNDDAWRHNTKE